MSAPARAFAPEILNVSRRDFLRTGAAAGAGLVLGLHVPGRAAAAAAAAFAPNVWLRIAPDNTVTVIIARSEMGQGVTTSLPMLVAEELEADWKTVRIELADSDKPRYGDQGTGGSESVRSLFVPLRQAGATAREMLITAAAAEWKVPRESCRASKGMVEHTESGRRLSYGALAAAAGKLEVPKEAPLKDPKNFRVLGTRIKRLDTPAKVDGSAVFGMDVRVPGMVYAAIARCPVFGGKLKSYDGALSKQVPGVRAVVPVEAGIAVVADNTWAAIEGRKALEVEWDEGGAGSLNSAGILKMFTEKASGEGGVVFRKDGDAEKAMAEAPRKATAVYSVPFLSHSPMEPMNCTAHVRPDRVEVWAPTQAPNDVQAAIAKVAGVPEDKVKLHITLLGGGFGRRLFEDYGVEAAQVSKATGAPVKVVWTREDDTRGGYYRPASYHKLAGAVGADGWPVAFSHHVVAPSILNQMYGGAAGGRDPVVTIQTPYLYATPNVHLAYTMANTPVTIGWWRAVYTTQCAFATECFVDEMAHAGGKDPLEFRRKLLEGDREVKILSDTWRTSRLRAVLELAAAQIRKGPPLARGRARGYACYPSFASYAAIAVEVSIRESAIRVHRAVCAIDCGQVVNPDTIEAQMEGSVVYALTAALGGQITIDRGRARQSNFHDYPMLRVDEMPAVETHIVRNHEAPGGIGEPMVGVVAPAVANAYHALTGNRLRDLPLKL